MSTRQEPKVAPSGTNNNTSADPTPLAAAQTTAGRFFELMCVLCGAGCLALLVLAFKNPLFFIAALVLLIIALLPYKFAVRTAVNEGNRQNQQQSKLKYIVNWGRLRTLERVGVPDDVIAALESLIHEGPLPAEEFLAKVAQKSDGNLSWERMMQWRETILIYTRADGGRTVAPASNGSQLQASVATKS